MEHVADKETHAAFNGLKITKKGSDVPDYLCARSVLDPQIAEAKGRYSAISFSSKEFTTWRSQFSNIEVRNRSGMLLSLKGFVVATRFVTDVNRSSMLTTMFVEDPLTPGDTTDSSRFPELGLGIIAVLRPRHREDWAQADVRRSTGRIHDT